MPIIYATNPVNSVIVGGNSFGIIQPPNGTSPTATTSTATLTLTSSGGSVTITGNSGTNTVNFDVTGTNVGGFTAGSVIFAGATGKLVQDNAKFFWDDTNMMLGIGTNTPASNIDIEFSVDGQAGLRVFNPSTGSSGQSVFFVGQGSGGRYAYFSYFGSGYASSGIFIAGSAILSCASSGGLNIWSEDAAGFIRFGTGGTNVNKEQMRITAAGTIGIGQMSPVSQLHVSSRSTTNITFIAQATTSQSVDIFEIQDGSTNVLFSINQLGIPKVSVNSTGAGTALLGSNSPAITLTAPYTWIQFASSDGSTVYIPAWK